jgi:RNA polymerase sigma-70 factor (sigma-E family)
MDPGEDSFRAFVRARSAALGRSAYLLTGDRHLAEDLLQTALYQAARRWGRITAAGDPEAYVRRILYTTHVSWWRRRRVTEAYGVELPDVVARADDPELRLALAQALARLTPKQRAVLVLRFYEDLSESQTAAMLGCAVGTVKSQTRHALGRLRVLAPELVDLVTVEVDS